jgi:hypothetical protein
MLLLAGFGSWFYQSLSLVQNDRFSHFIQSPGSTILCFHWFVIWLFICSNWLVLAVCFIQSLYFSNLSEVREVECSMRGLLVAASPGRARIQDAGKEVGVARHIDSIETPRLCRGNCVCGGGFPMHSSLTSCNELCDTTAGYTPGAERPTKSRCTVRWSLPGWMSDAGGASVIFERAGGAAWGRGSRVHHSSVGPLERCGWGWERCDNTSCSTGRPY